MTPRHAAPLLLLLIGCGGPRPPAPAAKPATAAKAPEPATKSYRLVGVVLAVDPEHGEVKIKHEAIPGLMPAMSMPFRYKDRAALEEIREGDEVEGTLRVGPEESELTDLIVTRPAPAAPLRLDFSGGTATLRQAEPPLEPGQEVPDFAVTTQDGQTLKLSDLRGKVVALTFIYTRCPLPEFCPRQDRKFAELAAKVAAVPARAERVRLLSVSFDPEHDTPEVLARHARRVGAAPPLWTFAVASHAELARVAGRFGLSYGPSGDEVIHNLCTALIGPDGRLVRLDAGAAGKAWEPADYFRAIAALARPGED